MAQLHVPVHTRESHGIGFVLEHVRIHFDLYTSGIVLEHVFRFSDLGLALLSLSSGVVFGAA